ncbi:MAG TPA: bifunctional UDP-N-acetylglucosamine diphosphorylase/glucosamine-1-phosphate N-acetyltransferase GlmU [Bryobacteraceae bacterium]|jgi:bifunctional UDP-N-acetylglucosamine pyrophosphorylase/glucosamine-1-phosphate N-acetyltransferase
MIDDASVVILAAGQGTRMKSRMAKVLHRAGGKPLVRHAIDAALEIARPERVFVVVGYQADEVRAEAEAAGVQSIHQTEQLGTGHAVMCGEDKLAKLGGRLIVFVGDCPLIRAATLEQLAETQKAGGAAATVITTEVDDPTGYGRIIRGPDGGVQEIVEQKAATAEQRTVSEINSGILCFDAGLLWRHIHALRPDNTAREYYLTDMVAILIRAGSRVTALKVPDASELLGINNRVELAEADRILRARKVRQLMLDGVTIEKPETVTIDPDVRIGMDTVIGPFAQITGSTVIGEKCQVGACSIVHNSVLADGAEVFPFSMVSESRLDSRAHAGPFARLRMHAHLGEAAHVGNFVELKKTAMGAGSKSMHLAYLGDSTIGGKVNIGAGTITCNYDGQKKHPTVIGDGTFVGSNSTLIAPLEIEHGAYIAAGSVINQKVPAKTLAVGRSRQVNKEGWKRRE